MMIECTVDDGVAWVMMGVHARCCGCRLTTRAGHCRAGSCQGYSVHRRRPSARWHIVRVLDVRDAQHKNIADEKTQKKTRRMYLDDQLDQYVIKLRKESFPVEIDDVMMSKLSQQEVDWYQEMLEKAQKSPEEVMEQIQRLQKGGQ